MTSETSDGGWRRYEDAEGMSGGVGVDPERFLGIVGPISQHTGAEVQRSAVRGVQGGDRRHRQIEMQHLWVWAVRPGCLGQGLDLLEGDLHAARRVSQDQPVLPTRIPLAGGWGLVAGAVPKSQELPVELGQRPGVGGVEDDLAQRDRRLIHDVILPQRR
jgi:hypothetical protein